MIIRILLSCVLLTAPLAGLAEEAITLDATSSVLKNDQLTFTDVAIAHGGLTISALSANTRNLDFTDSTWRFNNKVNIQNAHASIQADAAQLHFVNHRLKSADLSGRIVLTSAAPQPLTLLGEKTTILFSQNLMRSALFTGTPVKIETSQANGDYVTGEGQRLRIDMQAKTLQLEEQATLSNQTDSLNGHKIVYQFDSKAIAALADDSLKQRVHITFQANQDD